ncbi:MAG: CAP domain-containing protein, partial [Candidatus Magasanikbacteria bacterium]|nr:CAP domain-containing protein [Candidatus Magasanikbacteria bacterium]
MNSPWKNNKFLFYNLLALVFIKAVFSYSSLQFANLIDGIAAFGKEDIIIQTNTLRQTLGLGGLRESVVLDIAAAQKLQDMLQNQYFAHTSPAGVSPWHWIEVNQYKYSYAGENLAIGFLTAKDTVNAWANSPSHRANLLNANYKEIGIAIAPAKIQNSQGFLVVQLFGTPKPTVAPVASKPKPIAQIKPSPIITPVKAPIATQIAVLPSSAVKSATEENIGKPIVSQVSGISPELNKMAHTFNTAFILYALIAFLVSLMIMVFYGLKRNLVIRTAASFAILLLAIIVPV